MKASAIMVKPALPLRMLEPRDLEVLSRVLFQYFRGLDERHTGRWRRLWGRLFREDGVLQLYPVVERNAAFHARHMAIETRVFENQDGFVSQRAFREWLKTGACFGHFEAAPAGGLTFVPSSCSYEDCSDDEMREFHDDALAFLRSPHALATLWPAMAPHERADNLELLLRDPEEERSE